MKEELPLARSLKAEGLRLSNCNPVSILNIPQEKLYLLFIYLSPPVF